MDTNLIHLENTKYYCKKCDYKCYKKFNFEIVVKEKTDDPDVFICDVIKLYTEPSPENPRKTITAESEPVKDVEIKFLQSVGYVSEENQEKKEEK